MRSIIIHSNSLPLRALLSSSPPVSSTIDITADEIIPPRANRVCKLSVSPQPIVLNSRLTRKNYSVSSPPRIAIITPSTKRVRALPRAMGDDRTTLDVVRCAWARPSTGSAGITCPPITGTGASRDANSVGTAVSWAAAADGTLFEAVVELELLDFAVAESRCSMS